MIVNGEVLLSSAPVKGMMDHKRAFAGVSFGMSEAGYDLRIKQDIQFKAGVPGSMFVSVNGSDFIPGRFTLASAIEEFQMPTNLVGIVHDKSTWARRGLSVFNTVIEPGWNGFLTLELVYHGSNDLVIPAGSGIAQVVFHATSAVASYDGKYQNQEDNPVEAKESITA
ncbi:Deoxycytidine triphosphate deaminase [compost metagenome]